MADVSTDAKTEADAVRDVQERISNISERLKRPGLSNLERLLLHEDRKELRDALRMMQQAEGEGRA